MPKKGLSLENYTYLIDMLKAQNVCESFSVLIHVKNVCNFFPKGFWIFLILDTMYFTVSKLQNISVTQILREIKVDEFRIKETTVLCN